MSRLRADKGKTARLKRWLATFTLVAAGAILHVCIPARNAWAAPPEQTQTLHLEVFINGQPTNLIGKLSRTRDGRFSATRGELKELGITAPKKGEDSEIIPLDGLPGLGMRYDETEQKLFLTLPEDLRLAREYSAGESNLKLHPNAKVSDEFGHVLNYNVYGTSSRGYNRNATTYSTGAATLESRAFGPLGVLQNSAIAGTSLTKQGILRLDSSFVFAHRDSMIVGTLGDAVSGGLTWTRPIRHGGGQISRQFSLRPDLVTAPMPSVSGSAAVPSTVDVYVDNIRIASQQVSSGPFRISDLPVGNENGTARVVVRDVTGKETVTVMPFFTSAKLLAPGMFDFSVDAGYPRHNYAIDSFDYSKRMFGMASTRYGLTEWLTLESHGEITKGLVNGGGGAVIALGRFGLLSAAGAASWHQERLGTMVQASWQKSFSWLFVGLSSQRTFGKFEDVASVTALTTPVKQSTNLADSGFYLLQRSPRVPRAMDRISVGIPLPKWEASLAASFVNLERDGNDRSRLASLTYSQTFAKKYNMFVNGYVDLLDKKTAGVFAGLSFQLGDDLTMTTAGSATRSTWHAGAEITKRPGSGEHAYGWRVFDTEGSSPLRGASGIYTNPWSRIEAGVRQDRSSVGGSGEIDGAIVTTRSGIFATRRVTDAFAVVDTGAPGVKVLHENRVVGTSGRNGKVVVPNLQSFQRSKIAVAPESLPGDRIATLTETEVIPGYRGAAVVSTGSMVVEDTARIEIRGPDGQPFPAGTRVQHQEKGKAYTIGYGGIAYLPGIADTNTLTVAVGGASCRLAFTRAESIAAKGKLGPLACRME